MNISELDFVYTYDVYNTHCGRYSGAIAFSYGNGWTYEDGVPLMTSNGMLPACMSFMPRARESAEVHSYKNGELRDILQVSGVLPAYWFHETCQSIMHGYCDDVQFMRNGRIIALAHEDSGRVVVTRVAW